MRQYRLMTLSRRLASTRTRILRVMDLAEQLARGARAARKELDKTIRRLSKDWPPARQPAVDRNILRLAIYELSLPDSTPAAVVINEAVELAKRFSTADSGKFINGVLGPASRSENRGQRSKPSVALTRASRRQSRVVVIPTLLHCLKLGPKMRRAVSQPEPVT